MGSEGEGSMGPLTTDHRLWQRSAGAGYEREESHKVGAKVDSSRGWPSVVLRALEGTARMGTDGDTKESFEQQESKGTEPEAEFPAVGADERGWGVGKKLSLHQAEPYFVPRTRDYGGRARLNTKGFGDGVAA